jgi:O-antigen/teichoic acid export membrane protein
VPGLAAASLGANVTTAALLARLAARDFFPLRLGFDRQLARYFLVASFPLMLNALLNTLFFRIDVQLLQTSDPVTLPLVGPAPGGAEAVGHYAAAYRFVDAMQVLSSSFVLALFPMLARRAGADDRAGLAAAYGHALRLLLVVGLPAALLLGGYADGIIWLFAGPRFQPHASLALAVLAWFIPLSFVNGVTQYVLIATDRQRLITVGFAIAAAFNVGANLVLIPRFGYLAAAGVTVASEIVLLAPFAWAARRELRLALRDLRPLRPLLAAAVAAALLALLRPISPVGAVAVALLGYAALLTLSGAVGPADLAVLRRVLRPPL